MVLRFLFLFSIFISASYGTSSTDDIFLLNRTVQVTRRAHNFDVLPHEHTRPVVVGDLIYSANLDGEVSAVHRTLGYTIWKRKLPAGIQGALAYGRSKIFVGDTHGNLYGLNSRDGSVAWHFKINAEWLSPPTVYRDKVFISTSNDELFCLSETQGKEIWHYARRGDEKMTVRGNGSPAVFAGEVYQGFSDGFLVSLSAMDGKVSWTKRLRTRERFYDVDMTPWVDEDGIIAATFDGKLYQLDRLTGSVKWVVNIGSYGGFLVEDSRVFLAGLNKTFYSLNKANGDVMWKTPFDQGVGLTPVRVGEYIVVTTSADPLYVLDPTSGKIVTTASLGTGTFAAPATHADGVFYVMSNYGNLYGFEVMKRNPLKTETLKAPAALQQKIVQPTAITTAS